MIKRSNKKRMAYLFLFAMLVTLFPAGAAFAAVTMDTDKAYYVGNSVYANVYITDSVYANNAVNEIVYATVYSNVYADGVTIALDEDPGDTGNFWGKIGFNTTGNNVTLVDGVYRIPVDATNVNGDIVRIKYGSNEITRPWVPALAATSTTDGATNVSVSDNIYVDFNRDISSTVVNSTYFILEKLVTTYESVSTGVYLDNSKKVRIDPAADLDYSTTYRVTVLSSVYDDVYSGNTLGTNKQWTFTTAAAPSGGSGSGAPDTTKPTVSATTPANGATTIAVDTNLTVTFSEAMDANSLAKSEITFTGGTVSDFTYTWGSGNTVLTIDPVSNLSNSTTYTVTVNASVYDLAGNPMLNNYSWSFTTAAAPPAPDTTKPMVTDTTPANGATSVDVDTNLTVTFSEAMDVTSLAKSEITFTGGTVSDFTYSWGSGNTVLTIDPVSNLSNSTTYTVTVNAYVYDLAGNPMLNNYSWSFTTVSGSGSDDGTPGGTTSGGSGSDTPAPVQVTFKEEPPKKNPDGSITVEAKVSPDDFNKAFDSNKAAKEFVLEIKQSADEKLAVLPADAFSKLAERTASLVLKTESANLTIPGGAVKIADLAKQLGVDASKVEIKVSVEEIKKADADKAKEAKIAGMNPVTKVLEFTMEAAANGKSVKVDSFGGKVVKGEFPFTAAEAANIKDKAKLSVFKFNEKTGKWVYVRSKAADGKVIFFTTTFSKYTIMEYSKTFADVSTHWAKSEIELMASKFVVNGISSDKFAPEANVTRAQFAAMLVRALGLPTDSSNAAKFKDVKSTDWFAADVAAASQASLIQGFGDNTFKPNAQITRDQMAVMVTRALKAAGKDISVSKSEQDTLLAKFTDSSKVESWAKAEVAAAAKAGIINGVTSTSFAPAAKATRAESATMLKRMMTTGELL